MGAERLPFQALETDDPNNAAMIAQRIRMDYNYDKDAFIRSINDLSEREFHSFCIQVINWQHFFYELKGTVGTVSPEHIPPEQKKLFKLHKFFVDPHVQLTKDINNEEDPGIILQDCITSNRPRDRFINIIRKMNEKELEEFCTDIELLAYFATTQSHSYFSHQPKLIPRDHEHFWFND